MERFVFQRVDQRIVIEVDRFRLGAAAINNPWRLTGAAHPAARTAAFASSRKCGEFVLHDETPVVCGLPGSGARPPGRPPWRHLGTFLAVPRKAFNYN